MRALVIDPKNEIIRELQIDDVCETLGTDNARLEITLLNGDRLYFDGNLFIDNSRPVACFWLDANVEPPTVTATPGWGLLVGEDGDALTSVTELKPRIMFSWCRYWPDMGGIGLYSNEADANAEPPGAVSSTSGGTYQSKSSGRFRDHRAPEITCILNPVSLPTQASTSCARS